MSDGDNFVSSCSTCRINRTRPVTLTEDKVVMKLKITKEIVIESKFKPNAKFHQDAMHNVNLTIRKINKKTK